MEWETPSDSMPFKKHIIAGKFNSYCDQSHYFNTIGSVAGVVEHLAMYPVDTIKVNKIFPLNFSIDSYSSLWFKQHVIFENSQKPISK